MKEVAKKINEGRRRFVKFVLVTFACLAVAAVGWGIYDLYDLAK